MKLLERGLHYLSVGFYWLFDNRAFQQDCEEYDTIYRLYIESINYSNGFFKEIQSYQLYSEEDYCKKFISTRKFLKEIQELGILPDNQYEYKKDIFRLKSNDQPTAKVISTKAMLKFLNQIEHPEDVPEGEPAFRIHNILCFIDPTFIAIRFLLELKLYHLKDKIHLKNYKFN